MTEDTGVTPSFSNAVFLLTMAKENTVFEKGTFIIVPNKKHLYKLSAKAQVTWLALCAYADEDGTCYPSKSSLANLTGLGDRTITRGLEELKEKKWITWNVNKKPDGSFSSNSYTLFLLKSK